MTSTSLALEKYFVANGINYYCVPYIEFKDTFGNEFKFERISFGRCPILNRIHNSRWFIQYYGDSFDPRLLNGAINLLEEVLVTNGYKPNLVS